MVLTSNRKKTILPSASSPSSSLSGSQGDDTDDTDLPIVYASTFPPPPTPTSEPSPGTIALTEQPCHHQQHRGRYGDEIGDVQPEIPLSIVEVDQPSTSDRENMMVAGSNNTEEGTSNDNDVGDDDETKFHTTTKHGNTCAFNIGSGYDGESPWEKKCRRRNRRKARMVVGGLTGLVVGTVILCVPGAIVGTVVGVWATRSISKRRERLKDERVVMSSASSSSSAAAREEVEGPIAVATRVGDAKESN